MTLKFTTSVKHDRLEFFPGVALGFEDPRAEAYFTALGWAETTSDGPVRIYSADEVSIDPMTLNAATGALVLPSLSQEV